MIATYMRASVYFHCEHSAGAFLIVLPLWMVTDLPLFLNSEVSANLTSLFGKLVYYDLNKNHSIWVSIYKFTSFLQNKLLIILLLQMICGTLHYIYNMFSFMILSRTSPLTHVVLHAVRRLTVIVFSLIWFGNRVTEINILGMGLVFTGVFWYAAAKATFNQKFKTKL